MKTYSLRHIRRLSKSAACTSTSAKLIPEEHCDNNPIEPLVIESPEISSISLVSFNDDKCSVPLEKSVPNKYLEEELIEWKHSENITLQAFSSLLKILRKQPDLQNLPADARTLLKTPRSTTVVDVPPGKYYHFGLEEGLQSSIKGLNSFQNDEVLFDINVDGLPLTKSSNSQFWVIQGGIAGKSIQPFVIGIYHGYAKPKSAKKFLKPFIKDYRQITQRGIQINNSESLPVRLRCIICDAPAKSFVLNTAAHNSFNGCNKCQQRGRHIDRRVVYSTKKKTPRSDEDFANCLYEDHQIGRSPLSGLGIGLVTQTVLDYMHVVGLGVTKKLLTLWTHGRNRCRISSNIIIAISSHLVKLKIHIPNEFQRKPRALSEFKRWKFTELRLFLLYTSIVVLRSRIDSDYYEHFLCLFCAIFMLATPNISESVVDYAQELINYFVAKFKLLYGAQYVSYNLHALLHIPEDVKSFGPLDSFSATRFENNLQKIKKQVRRSNEPLPQIVRRMAEGGFNITFQEPNLDAKLERRHFNGPTAGQDFIEMYRKLRIRGLLFTNGLADSVCQLNSGEIVTILNILKTANGIKLVVKGFLNLKDFFVKPCNSSSLGIYRADLRKTTDEIVISASDIQRKYVSLPLKHFHTVLIPLIHS